MAVIDIDNWNKVPTAGTQASHTKHGRVLSTSKSKRGAKDVLSAAVTTQSGTESEISKKAAPLLPTPAKPYAGVQGTDGDGNDNMSLIAIIGMVLALQAKTSSQYWQNLWKQASESMNMQVNFAPIVAKAIKSSYDAQVSATQNEAKGALGAGISQIVAFGLSIGGGAFSTYKGLGSEQIKEDAKNIEELGEEAPAAAEGVGEEEGFLQAGNNEAKANSDANNSETAAVAARSDAQEKEELEKVAARKAKGKAPAADEVAGPPDNPLDPEEKVYSSRATKLKNALSKVFTSKNVTAMYENSLRAGQLAGMLGQGSQQIIQAQYQSKAALFRGIQGQAEALKSLSEMLAQYYGQNFSRANELTSGAQQSIDTVMNILNSASQAVTGAVNSMFRG